MSACETNVGDAAEIGHRQEEEVDVRQKTIFVTLMASGGMDTRTAYEENAASLPVERAPVPFEPSMPTNIYDLAKTIIKNPYYKYDFDPQVLYRSFYFCCPECSNNWTSSLFKASTGLFCQLCCHFARPIAKFDNATPYVGDLVCYGQFKCHKCCHSWYTHQSRTNWSQPCFQCGTLNFPHIQIPLGTMVFPPGFYNFPTYDNMRGQPNYMEHNPNNGIGPGHFSRRHSGPDLWNPTGVLNKAVDIHSSFRWMGPDQWKLINNPQKPFFINDVLISLPPGYTPLNPVSTRRTPYDEYYGDETSDEY